MRWIVVVLLIFFTTLQYRLWVGPGSWAQVASLTRELDEKIQANEYLHQRNKLLENEIHFLKNGLQGVEERARVELGLIKKDETFYLLIDDNNKP